MKRLNKFFHLTGSVWLCMATWCFLFASTSINAQSMYRYASQFPSIQQPWHFKTPSSVAVTMDGHVLVADTDNHRIVKLNPDGQLVTTWGQYGHGDGQFDQPSAIALDQDGNVYVLDAALGNNKISKFDSNGIFLLSWGKSGDGENDGQGEFSLHQSLSDIVVSSDNEIYISDTENDRIQKFTTEGSFVGFIQNFSGECLSDCQLIYPSGLAFNDNGNLFILHYGVDTSSGFPDRYVVTELAASGEYQNGFNLDAIAAIVQGSQLARMVIDHEGVLHVTDMANGRIFRLSSQGQYLGYFGEDAALTYQLTSPSDLCFGEDGKLFISDNSLIVKNVLNSIYQNRIIKLDKESNFINSWQSYGSQPGMFHGAQGMSIDINGFIYVADTYNHRVQKLDPNGNPIVAFGVQGDGDGEFEIPLNIDVDSAGFIYVVDSGTRKVQKFDSNGEFILAWGGGTGVEDGQFKTPVGVAVDVSGNVFVADSSKNSIQVFSSDGLFIEKFGVACVDGDIDGCFESIDDIDIDEQGNIFVSDHREPINNEGSSDGVSPASADGLSRIQIFSSNGEYISTISQYGDNPGDLNNPSGITVDSSGNVYVADLLNSRVQKFSPEGDLLDYFGTFGTDPGQFLSPVDVAVGRDGELFVLDASTNTVQRFNEVDPSMELNRKAIIIAGGGPYPGNTLWNTTRSCANFAYRTLRHKGYAKDEIYYFCEDEGLDIDGNGLFDDVYGKPTKELIEQLITDTATDADQLLIYFTDHGGDETFQLSGDVTLSAETLDGWLDSYEAASAGHTTMIYDACQSGSFISAMTPYAEGSRTVMTSSGSDEYAYFVSFGTISFSEYFWTAVFNGHDMTSAFQQAQNGITQLELSQRPEIDANGNGIANEMGDFDAALSNSALNLDNHGKESAGREKMADFPVIGESDAITLVEEDGSAVIEVRNVTDSDGIERVWATIIPPDYMAVSPDVPVTRLIEVELQPVAVQPVAVQAGDHGVTYQSNYTGFTTPGTYRVTVYARDIRGNNAVPVTMAFVTDGDTLPKAIVVSTASNNPSRSSIYRSLADQAMNTLKAQGFSEDRINPLHSPTSAQIASAVTEWALDSTTLIVFVVGDGDDQGILLGNSDGDASERMPPSLLKTWLDSYQAASGGRVAVIIDADQSGQFVNALAQGSQGGENGVDTSRVVVTSTDRSGRTSFESMGLSSFSSYFWNAVYKGADIKDAFFSAKNAVSYLAQSLVYLGQADALQTSQLDDNGNGIANEDDEGGVASAFQIGLGIITGSAGYITADIPQDFQLDGEISAMLTVTDIRSSTDIESIWAVVTPPAVSEAKGDIGMLSLPLQYLIPDGDGGYQWMYSDFSLQGNYLVDFFVRDLSGNIQLLGRTSVLQNRQPDTESVVQVGGGKALEMMTVAADQSLRMTLGIDPVQSVLESLQYEWILVAFGDPTGDIQCYLFSPRGLVDPFDLSTMLSAYTFPLDHSRTTMHLGTFNLASIGLSDGDFFAYAHVYTDDEAIEDIMSASAIYGNVVYLTIQ